MLDVYREPSILLKDSLTHVVCFTLLPGISRTDPRAQRAATITASHRQHIPEISNWICGWDRSGRPDSFDYLVVGSFRTQDAYQKFQQHADHIRGKNAWAAIATWRVADVGSPST